jgi:dihydrofolate reductase
LTATSSGRTADLIDEYRARVCPVPVGGGIPFFPKHQRRVDLDLLETRTFSSRVLYLRYGVVRQAILGKPVAPKGTR